MEETRNEIATKKFNAWFHKAYPDGNIALLELNGDDAIELWIAAEDNRNTEIQPLIKILDEFLERWNQSSNSAPIQEFYGYINDIEEALKKSKL